MFKNKQERERMKELERLGGGVHRKCYKERANKIARKIVIWGKKRHVRQQDDKKEKQGRFYFFYTGGECWGE